MKKQTKYLTQPGFTIVELLIVIVVIAVLAALAVVSYQGIQARAQDSQKTSNITNIMKVLNANYVTEGRYTPEIFMSFERSEGGGFNLEELARLNHYGIDPSIMHNPNAPEKMHNSFVFNKEVYNENTDTFQKIAEFNDSDPVTLEIWHTVPQGYSSWDDFYESTQSIVDEYRTTYETTHPFPTSGDYEDEDAWYAGFMEYVKSVDPELYELGGENPFSETDVPKTALYIVDVLVPAGREYGYCNYQVYYGDDYNDDLSTPEYRCSTYGYPGYTEVTGIKISYYNKSSKSWIEKTIGTGNPILIYDLYN